MYVFTSEKAVSNMSSYSPYLNRKKPILFRQEVKVNQSFFRFTIKHFLLDYTGYNII